MDETNLIDKLMEFGLTRQESIIYICLLQNSELSGYEVAKQTGISRSNVYSALSGLVDKGAIYLLEGATNKYTAVAAEDFCNNKMRFLQKVKEELVENLKTSVADTDGYITISSYRHIVDKVYVMLAHVKERIYFSAPAEFIELFHAEIMALLEKKIKVVLITEEILDFPESIFYLVNRRDKQIRFIVDSAYVLTGDITGSASDTCLYCAQKNFVNVFKEALRNEIKLIELTGGESENE